MSDVSWSRYQAIAYLIGAVLLSLALATFHPDDLPFDTSEPPGRIANAIGLVGAYAAWGLFRLIGYAAWGLPVLCVVWGAVHWSDLLRSRVWSRVAGSLIALVCAATLLSLGAIGEPSLQMERGGWVGLVLTHLASAYFGFWGTAIISVTIGALALLMATEFAVLPILARLARLPRRLASAFVALPVWRRQAPQPSAVVKGVSAVAEKPSPPAERSAVVTPIRKEPTPRPTTVAAPTTEAPRPPRVVGDYRLPSLDLLQVPPPVEARRVQEDLQANARLLEEALADFGIEARVAEVEQGPVITRYELQPAPGVKVNRIVALSDDIALVMKAPSIRIVAPIPGKARVGVEVPNSRTHLVYLREVLESPPFKQGGSPLTLGLGKDVAGEPLMANLTEMPHLLIAGTTGSGKTVCVNAIIMSILFHASPDEVQFLLVDPKMVELACFDGLPHLISPVVKDVRKAAGALNWVVTEMEDRYRLFARTGVRNIEGYNSRKAKRAGTRDEGRGTRDEGRDGGAQAQETSHERRATSDEQGLLPYIIVVIDELADLMVVSSREVEDAIIRLAQLSRAVGIHMILATQRPSVDVITGVIKANFPARISFQVASKVDSRTVLDMNGADKLLGKGDMLFLRPGTAKPIRAQASLVTDEEIERVAAFIKRQRSPVYREALTNTLTKDPVAAHLDIKDEMYDAAVEVVLTTGQASTSMLQRKLRLSYVRAARLMDLMEQEGIVGPGRGAKPREILVDREGRLQPSAHSTPTES